MHLSRERHNRLSALSRTARDPLVHIAEVNFTCPHCASFFEVVRAKTLPDKVDPKIVCPTCSGLLPAREAQFALKYFLLRKADRGWRRTPVDYQSARL
jgi:hypothetical protein